MEYPRSAYETVGGIVYFGRMLDKIRLNDAGHLPPDYHANLGAGFDKMCVDFLHIQYADVVMRVREKMGDEAILQWCFLHGRRPTPEEIEVWNGYMSKRGWRDSAADRLALRKKESGFENRAEIRTMFDYLDADEGRPVRP
ncbi:MAG: DUF5069 domain-containing protein [Puniceicoccales bacterium]|jgi:gluconokinase|nr:DUF5069 domain-containing protein [Puniceicoccales bacterium]